MTKKRREDSRGQGAPAATRTASTTSRRPSTIPEHIDAPFAIASDGSLLMNVMSLAGCDLHDRPLFVSVKLTDEERRVAGERIDDAAHELQGSIGGQLLKPPPAKKREP